MTDVERSRRKSICNGCSSRALVKLPFTTKTVERCLVCGCLVSIRVAFGCPAKKF